MEKKGGGAEGSKVALVQAWYEEAIVRVQAEQLGKVNNAAILAAMVAKYPPDWDQAISVPIDSGITRVMTVLGPDQPASVYSPDTLDAVRTIAVDVTEDDEVVGSRLLEFVSPDPLEPDDFTEYIQQWGNRDFGDHRMLISEYDIGYDAKTCEVYTPGEGFEPVELTLAESSGMGKAQDDTEYWCYITDIVEGWVCVGPVTGEEYCRLDTVDVYITCVEIGGEGGGSGGGGGEDEEEDECEDDKEDEEEEECEEEGECEEEDEEEDEDGCEEEEEEKDEEECSCADAIPCEMEAEYDSLNVDADLVLSCDQFTTSGGTGNFPWWELNDNWSEGNEPKHNPWGRIDPLLPAKLEALRALAVVDTLLDINALPLSSGYRCPVGNSTLPGAKKKTSRHITGRAADISTRLLWEGLGDEDEWRKRYDRLEDLAEGLGLETLPFDRYLDHHLHVRLPDP